MFEYLMPLLIMRAYPNTLLDETYEAVVSRQMKYGAQRGVPWGISESAYNLQDLDGNYQYRAFGVPVLGLKRGLADASATTKRSTTPRSGCRKVIAAGSCSRPTWRTTRA